MNLRTSFNSLLNRAGFLENGEAIEGFLQVGSEAAMGPSAGRHSCLFDRERFPFPIEAVFMAGGAATIVFVDATDDSIDDERAVECHQLAWNFGLAPLLWIATSGSVLLLDSYRRPSGRLRDVELARFRTDNSEDVQHLVNVCGRLSFDTGAFWSSSFAREIDRKDRVDAVLLRQLAAVERRLCQEGLPPLLAQKLIGRAIFAQYLVDRQILKPELLMELFGHKRLSATLRSDKTAPLLFDWLRNTFNGDLFPPDIDEEQTLVTPDHLAKLADFLEGHDAITGQLSAFPFRFDVIPVELISSIYEQFAHSIAGEDAASQGLHYTPVNLVDLSLDHVMEDISGSAKVLDPACGSGVFLVEAMRRLVWQRTRHEPNTRELVRDVLHNQIFGVDINAGALQVAAFGLYLAALELDPELKSGKIDWLRFDHLIGRNLLHASFFDELPFAEGEFDLVIGNPPWTYAGASQHKPSARLSSIAQPRRSPDWAFLWRARELAKPDARLALLMKATPFFSKDRVASEARRLLLTTFYDVRIINLSQLRSEGLFPALASNGELKVRANTAPALLFSGRPGVRDKNSTVEVANVAWSPNFRRNGIITLTADDLHAAPLSAVVSDPVLFKAAVFGNDREYQVMEGLQLRSSLTRLGEWCDTNRVRMEQGLQLGGGGRGDARALLDLPFLDAQSYAPIRINARRLPQFAHDYAHRPRVRDAYRAPLVICPEAGFARALRRGRYSASVVHEDAVFTDSFVGISFTGHDPLLADALALILNSKLTAFLLALGGSNTGLKQPKIEKVDLEALTLPDLCSIPDGDLRKLSGLLARLAGKPSLAALDEADNAVMDLYDIDHQDRKVIDDILITSRPIFNDSRHERETAISSVTANALFEYGSELAHWLDTALREISTARTVVTRGVRIAPDVIALRLDIEDGPTRPLSEFQICEPELFEGALFEGMGGTSLAKFRSGRNLRIYSERSIYIVKPDETRLWTCSNAQTDLCRILDDVRSKRSNGPKLGNWRLEAESHSKLLIH